MGSSDLAKGKLVAKDLPLAIYVQQLDEPMQIQQYGLRLKRILPLVCFTKIEK